MRVRKLPDESLSIIKSEAMAQAKILRAVARSYREKTVRIAREERQHRSAGDYARALMSADTAAAYAVLIMDLERLARRAGHRFKEGV